MGFYWALYIGVKLKSFYAFSLESALSTPIIKVNPFIWGPMLKLISYLVPQKIGFGGKPGFIKRSPVLNESLPGTRFCMCNLTFFRFKVPKVGFRI